MNLIFRMLFVWLRTLGCERMTMENAANRLPLRVLPNDLDINLHMNNGRYLTICDLNRIDMFIRSGLVKTMRKRGWFPVIAEHTMSYKKSLHLFERYIAEMELTHHDEKYFYMTHTFRTKDRIAASGTSRGAIRSREGVIPPEQVLAAITEDNP